MSAGGPPPIAYLHGFASSPLAKKGVALAERFAGFGHELHRPDLNCPRFGELRVSAMLEALDAMDANRGGASAAPWFLIGSSMGAWAGALWASAHPERVARALWLAPGFHLASRWPHMMGAEAFARWEREGWLELPDSRGIATPVHFGLVEDARHLDPAPAPIAPTHIIHGRRDAVVPIEGSRRYVRDHALAKHPPDLTEVDDDHGLHASMATIWDLTRGTLDALLRGG